MGNEAIKRQSFLSIESTIEKTRESNKIRLDRELGEMPHIREFLDKRKSKYVCPGCKQDETTHEKFVIKFVEVMKDKKPVMVPELTLICRKCGHKWKVAYKRA